jgi:excisionase family DNA binding protein
MDDQAATVIKTVPDEYGEDSTKTDDPSEQKDHPESLVRCLAQLTMAIRDLVARSPVSSEELLTADQLGALFRLSPRTLRDLASAGLVPHHRIGKHYRFSRSDIAEILDTTKQTLRNRQRRQRVA